MPINGLGQAAIPILGYNLGARRTDRIHGTMRTVLPIAIGLSLLATTVFWLMPEALLGLFSPTADMLATGVPALRILAVTFPLGAISVVLGSAMSGLDNGVVNMLGTDLRQLLLLIPLAYLFSRLFGIGQIWYAAWISEVCAALYVVLAFRRIVRALPTE